jgi:hypothetical protein
MREESIIRELVQPYLVELGYPQSMISSQVRTRERQPIDLVVHDQAGPRIVVEVKPRESFPDNREPGRLRFDPRVRQLQSYATELGALYYLLTDGESYLWFRTDDSGRPHLLDSPIRPVSIEDVAPRQPSRETILDLLWKLGDIFRMKGTFPEGNELATVILAKLLSERGDNRLRQALLDPIDEGVMLLPSLNLSLGDLRNRQYLSQALETLDTVSFTDAALQDVLSALDETLVRTFRGRELLTPRWLADFLVHLSQLRPDAVVLNPCCSYGNILAAVSMPQKEVRPTSVWGISHNANAALWAKVQLVVLGLQEDRVLLGAMPPYNTQDAHNIPAPTNVIAVPPFGGRFRGQDVASTLFSKGVSGFEDLYLELAIEWVQSRGRVVMVVPEDLLFSGGKRRLTREYIQEHTRIAAIISLAGGVLLPFAGKVSILVLDKEPSFAPYQVFMSHVDDVKFEDSFDSRDIPQTSKVLDDFEEWNEAQQLRPGSVSWVVPIKDLRIDNFTATRYRPFELAGYDKLTSPYPMVPLDRVTDFIRRGTSIKLDEAGDLRVIGPGAIRPMMLDISQIGSTSESNKLSRAITAEAGDVVLNNIGTHLGAVAVVNETVANSYVSQHVVLIRPDISKILPEYLAAAINSDYVRPQIKRIATGTLMPALSVQRLRDVEIPLPDLAVQRRVVMAIEKAHDKLKQKREQLEHAEAEFQDIVRRLSTGVEK